MTGQWQTEKAFPKTNMHMFDDEILCDVTFLAGESKQAVKAHKFILASRSPVFYAMFCGPLAESSDAIHIPDIEADILRPLLRFMYTGECPINPDNVLSLHYAAKKYDIVHLYKTCKEFLETNITPETVCTILQQAHLFNEKGLVNKCTQFINKNGKAILQSEGLLSVSKDILKSIVQSDSLSVDESEVFLACMHWSQQECKRIGRDITDANCRAVLGEVIQLIRFPLMSLETFTYLVSEREILNDQEKLLLFQYFGHQKETPNYSLFPDKPRSDKKVVTVCRFDYYSRSDWRHNGTVDAISFACSKDSVLSAVVLFAPSIPGHLYGKIDVSEGSTTRISEDFNVAHNPEIESTEVKFSYPITIRKDTLYTIAQTCRGPNTYAGRDGPGAVQQDGLDVRFYASDKSKVRARLAGCQFKEMIFCTI